MTPRADRQFVDCPVRFTRDDGVTGEGRIVNVSVDGCAIRSGTPVVEGMYQGGYDWGVLAYTVGYGGSLVWFGSSAGVAISNIFPEAKSTIGWLRDGWHVAVGYVLGFFAMIFVAGWSP